MKISKISNFVNIFVKSADTYKRRRIVPRWQAEAPPEEAAEAPPEGEQGFLGDFGEENSTKQIVDWMESNILKEQESVPVETSEEGDVTQPAQVYTGVGSPARKPKREKAKSQEELADDYWKDLQSEKPSGYKPQFLGEKEPEVVKGPEVSKKRIEREKGDVPKGDIYRSFEQAELGKADKERKERESEQKAKTFEEESEKFEQGDVRLEEIVTQIQETMDFVKQNLILPKLFGSQAPIIPGRGKQPDETAPADLVRAFKQIKAGGGDAKMVKVQFPKTPYTEPFIGWVLAPVESDSSEIRQALIKVHNLNANKRNIEHSKMSREERMKANPINRFDQFFDEPKRRPVSAYKLIDIFKTAVDALEQSQEEIAEQMESQESFEDEPGTPVVEEEIPTPVEEKKTSIEAMNQSLLNEANSMQTSPQRLVEIAKMQNKFAIPAMRTFLKVAEKLQEPLFNYAKDILYGRVPEHEDDAKKFLMLKKEYDQMSEDDISADPYNTVKTLFTLWGRALQLASRRKFRGQKGKGRGKTYDAPISPKKKQRKYKDFKVKKEEAPVEIFYRRPNL